MNDIFCQNPTLHTKHTFHADRVTPFVGTPAAATALGHLDRDEYIVESSSGGSADEGRDTISSKRMLRVESRMLAKNVVHVLVKDFVGAKKLWSEFGSPKGMDMLTCVPQNVVTRLVRMMWGER